jgi:hypothetical protein
LIPQPEALEGRSLLSRGGYVFATLDDPNAGTGGTSASGINDPGQIVGYYQDANMSPMVS